MGYRNAVVIVGVAADGCGRVGAKKEGRIKQSYGEVPSGRKERQPWPSDLGVEEGGSGIARR